MKLKKYFLRNSMEEDHGKHKEKCNVCSDFQTLRRKKVPAPMQNTQPCPLDANTLGNATWAFLHTMAAYYPPVPTKQDVSIMKNFIAGLARFYPCSDCALHLQQEIKNNPPRLKDNLELSQWFCEVHNEVNVRLGKQKFDCSKVFERWKTGSKGSDCFPEF
jgi:FAD-linked sulfhydryl oxidase